MGNAYLDESVVIGVFRFGSAIRAAIRSVLDPG